MRPGSRDTKGWQQMPYTEGSGTYLESPEVAIFPSHHPRDEDKFADIKYSIFKTHRVRHVEGQGENHFENTYEVT